MRQSMFGILPLFWLLFAVISTESRSVNRTEDDATEEDFDLENALSDYYDSLMELWSLGQKTEENQEVQEDDTAKPKREKVPANNPSGLLSAAPNGSENGTKNYYDLTIPIQIGNVTYRFLNESHAAILDRQRTNRERETDQGNTERIKKLRLNFIKESVMGLRGGNSSQNNTFFSSKQTRTFKELFEKQGMGSSAWLNSNKYLEKSQSFFPSCGIPKNTDEAAWSEPYSMNLFFDVDFPAPKQDFALMVVNAALKLNTFSQMNQRSVNISNYGLDSDDEKRIRISVYWHTRSVRRQRIKRKLLDSQMLPLNGENELTFDIRPAVRSWKESGKNFGLQVIVEDENGTIHRPNDYIYPMNCSKFAAPVKPLPIFGFDSAVQYFLEDTAAAAAAAAEDRNNADEQGSFFPYRPVKYPVLGLQTRDVSLSELQNLMTFKSAQMELASKYRNNSQRQQRVSDSYDSSKDSSLRITDFENVPLGVPLTQNINTKPSEDNNLKPVEK